MSFRFRVSSLRLKGAIAKDKNTKIKVREKHKKTHIQF